MADTIVKQDAHAPEGFFEAEAAGLRWLAEAEDVDGVRIARVISVVAGRIELEHIHEVGATRGAAHEFGRALARTHDSGAVAFGCPPPGWRGPLFIGKRRQAAAAENSWGAFYARDRVLPFLDIAVEAGSVTAAEEAEVRAACELVSSGSFDDDEPPARLHGDLWNGNVLWAADGVRLIDPAAHGGHRETDLAMLQLFGVPYLDAVLAGYQTQHPLRAGWRERVPLHQMHPLAVHAAGYGRSYGRALHDAALRTLALASA